MDKYKISLNYKLTNSKIFKCSICEEKIDGKEGYIKIPLGLYPNNWVGSNIKGVFKICWNCWDKQIKEINNARDTRKEDYDKMLKNKILKQL
jgi:hypothetical protein